MSTFNQKLREQREARGLSQQAAAREIGISKVTYNRAENGLWVKPVSGRKILLWLHNTKDAVSAELAEFMK
jgi:transcriptional regulator with XRE-family HTH domain